MDQDIDLSLDDEVVEEPQSEDELLRYLEDTDEDSSEEDKAEKVRKAEEERLQAIVDRKIADRFMSPPPVKEERQAPPQPAAPVADHEKLLDQLADDIVNDLAMDPKAAVRKVLQATQAMTKQSGESAAARANRMAIDQYRASRANDPLFKAIQEDFDAEVNAYSDAQLGAATPAQLKRALELAEDSAAGRLYKKQLSEKQTRRAADPPKYGNGGSAAARPGGNVRLSQSQRDLIRMGKSAGLSDKDIRELIRENK